MLYVDSSFLNEAVIRSGSKISLPQSLMFSTKSHREHDYCELLFHIYWQAHVHMTCGDHAVTIEGEGSKHGIGESSSYKALCLAGTAQWCNHQVNQKQCHSIDNPVLIYILNRWFPMWT